MPFSRICNSILPEQNCIIFSVENPSGQDTFHAKFQPNPLSHHGDTHLQSSSQFLHIFLLNLLFAHFRKIAKTRVCFSRFSLNLEGSKNIYGTLTVQFVSRLGEKQKGYERFSKIKSLIFANAYRVKHLKKSLENRSKDGVINVMQTFCGLKAIGIMVMEL